LSHNLITCVEGKFNIKVFDKEKITINKLMQKGDILFVPAGIDHQVTPLTKRLSISFPAATNFDFFQEREWIDVLTK
jgi:ribosomal protein L16 Arg81 hydroxylase